MNRQESSNKAILIAIREKAVVFPNVRIKFFDNLFDIISNLNNPIYLTSGSEWQNVNFNEISSFLVASIVKTVESAVNRSETESDSNLVST